MCCRKPNLRRPGLRVECPSDGREVIGVKRDVQMVLLGESSAGDGVEPVVEVLGQCEARDDLERLAATMGPLLGCAGRGV